MSLNTLIAMGGRQTSSPVERFLETKNQMEQGQVRQLGMQKIRQDMGINQQKQMISVMAPLAKAVLSADPANRQQVYQESLKELGGIGIDVSQAPQIADETSLNAIMMAGGLEIDKLDAPVKRTMPAGKNEQGQNLVVDRLYQGEEVIEESEPYIKKEILRQADVDAADYGAKGTESNRFKLKEARSIAEKSLYKQTKGIDDLVKLVENPDFVGGFIGDSLSNINSLTQGMKNAFGIGSAMVDGNISPDLSDSKQFSALRRKAINGDRYSALKIELAYAKAKMVDPASKITDKDFDFASKMLASGSDKAGILATLKDNRKRGWETYNAEERLTKNRNDWYEPQIYSEEKYRGLYGMKEPSPVTPDLQSISNEDLLRQLSQ